LRVFLRAPLCLNPISAVLLSAVSKVEKRMTRTKMMTQMRWMRGREAELLEALALMTTTRRKTMSERSLLLLALP
jgi:hypothetical protein